VTTRAPESLLGRFIRTEMADGWRDVLSGLVELIDSGMSIEDALRQALTLAEGKEARSDG